MWVWIGLAAISLGLIAVWPFSIEWRRPVVGPTERHRAEGGFAQLSQGVTHYRWMGPTRGPVAVVIHGFATPMEAMETVAEGLGSFGYRVLLYDLYGRGLSDAPRGLQDRAFFLRQLSDLLTYFELTEEVSLVGYSMGGSIAVAYAVEQPYQIKQVILLSPTGLDRIETRFSAFCRRVPWLGDWWHALFAYGRIAKTIPERGQTPAIDKAMRAYRRDTRRRGYLPALLSSRRGMMAEMQRDEHIQLFRKGMPVTAIWAQADPMIPLTALGKLAQWNRAARHEVVKDAGYGMPYTHGRETVAALRDALHD